VVPWPGDGPLAGVIIDLMVKEPAARTSLRRVRRRLYPMRGSTPDLFAPELFRTPDGERTSAQPDATDTQAIEAVPRSAPSASSTPSVRPAPAAGPADGPGSTELAADPGPLPFESGQEPAVTPVPARAGSTDHMPTVFATPVRPRRGAATTAALAVAAVVSFLLAAGGGFVLARAIGEQPLRPPPAQPATATSPPAFKPLVPRDSEVLPLASGSAAGHFTVAVPSDWLKFVTLRSAGRLLPSAEVIQFVSPDGRWELALERFDEPYTPGVEQRYREALQQKWQDSGGFNELAVAQPSGDDSDLADFEYRTTERDAQRPDGPAGLSRTTFTRLLSAGGALWALSVTAPLEQETVGRSELFDRIVPTFSVSAGR
jgi:hypothetical protein